jgi:hypothetical protein
MEQHVNRREPRCLDMCYLHLLSWPLTWMLKIEKMYGCAMLVGSVTFFQFWWFERPRWHQACRKKQNLNSFAASMLVWHIYICQGSTNIDAQTGYFEQYSANMDIHSKILGFRQVSCGGVSNDSIPWQSCKKKRDTTRFWNRCFWWQSYLAMFC